MEDDNDWVTLSAIQHYTYCPRQYGLIFMEQSFEENLYTSKGRWAHERVDEQHIVSSHGYRILTALPVWSDKYGLNGKCDVVELHGNVPYPVEFKHGPRSERRFDDLQLCAQAICLEEMFGVPVPEGAIFYVSSKRRRKVCLTDDLRRQVLDVASAIRRLRESGNLPSAVHDHRCTHCSLQSICMPEWTDGRKSKVTWQWVLERLDRGEFACARE